MKSSVKLLLLSPCLILFWINRCHGIGCTDENGKLVDWFVLYKLPHTPDHDDLNVKAGVAYLYATSDMKPPSWTLSSMPITSSRSIPAKTLSPIFQPTNTKGDVMWVMYNDAPPNGTEYDSSFGHTKGVVLGDSQGGAWMVHSVPKYPFSGSKQYAYPVTGTIYGQSFLCISLSTSQLDNIGVQLMYNHANVFDSFLSQRMSALYPNLTSAASCKKIKKRQRKTVISSTKGQNFLSFAKSRYFNDDLYSGWVADSLRAELLTETWIHGHRLPSVCNTTYEVLNVMKVSIPSIKLKFESFRDHSKWAISANRTQPWVCIGDINRATGQQRRGGGTVCLNNSQLWQIYFNTVAGLDPCPPKTYLYLQPRYK